MEPAALVDQDPTELPGQGSTQDFKARTLVPHKAPVQFLCVAHEKTEIQRE